MPTIKVEKLQTPDETKSPILKRINDVFRGVEQRAFDIFKQRDARLGNAFEDWLLAENELIEAPRTALAESDKKIELQIALPGFDAGEIEVTAMPQEVVVHAVHKSSTTAKKEGTVWSEFENKTVCRRIPLPKPITVDSASSELNLGMLRFVADKAPSAEAKRIDVATAA